MSIQHHHQTVHSPRIFISAAEPSGDLHAAALMREIKKRRPDAIFVGVAGPKMQQEGCYPIADFTKNAAMLTGALGSVKRAANLLADITHEFAHNEYHAAILIDSPMLNLPIALRAKSRAIPVLYYVAPQLWAWGRYRIHKVKARIDRLAVILPFEEEFFASYGFDVTYVGHPLIDSLIQHQIDSDKVAKLRDGGNPVIAILPGSRMHVVRQVLPGQLELAAAIRNTYPNARIRISVAREDLEPVVRSMVRKHQNLSTTLHRDENAELLTASDLALVASGTATLEVAYYNTPMITMYNGGKLFYHLFARWMLAIKHLSLVNILAGREIIPEFMPYYDSTAPIIRTALDLLSNESRRASMRSELAKIITTIEKPGASARTAEMLLDMVDSNH